MSNQKKKERQRLKRKRKQVELRKERNKSVFQTLASQPVGAVECWINDNWREVGEASLIVLRDAPGGTHIFAAYLIDAWCSGLKDAFGHANASRVEFDARVKGSFDRGVKLVRIDVSQARRLVAGAMRLSVKNGFRLPHRADRWAGVIGVTSYADADLSLFEMHGGKYHYIGTMADLHRRLIGPPDEFLHRPDIAYTMEVGREVAEEYADDEDEEFDPDEPLDVEGDEEFEQLLESIGRIRMRAHDAIHKWFTDAGRTPHPRLADGVEVALAAAMVHTAAAGRMEAGDRKRNLEALLAERDDPDAVAEALEQVTEFMNSFSTPDRMLEAFGHSRFVPGEAESATSENPALKA